MFQKIILICTGNICRSPIAEELLKHQLQQSKIQIISAGIAALVNHPADPMAQAVMAERGYNLCNHRAQQATLALLSSSDLILTLDKTHTAWIQQRYPEMKGRMFKLGHWQGNLDVADPYRGPKIAFDQAFEEIWRYTNDWVKRISKV